MAYEYTEKVLERWDYPAQAALYREKFQQETNHWRGRATTAETQLAAITPGYGASSKAGN